MVAPSSTQRGIAMSSGLASGASGRSMTRRAHSTKSLHIAPATISGVAVALSQCGVPIRDLTLRTPTLDDVFLELTGSHFQRDTHPHDEEAA